MLWILGACVSDLRGLLMTKVVRNSNGDWCVAVPVVSDAYGTVTNARKLKRIPINKEATYERAVFVAKQMGLV